MYLLSSSPLHCCWNRIWLGDCFWILLDDCFWIWLWENDSECVNFFSSPSLFFFLRFFFLYPLSPQNPLLRWSSTAFILSIQPTHFSIQISRLARAKRARKPGSNSGFGFPVSGLWFPKSQGEIRFTRRWRVKGREIGFHGLERRKFKFSNFLEKSGEN